MMGPAQRLSAHLTPGATVVCVEDTFDPFLGGRPLTVVAVGKYTAHLRGPEGETVYRPLPVGECEWIDDRTARWTLDPAVNPEYSGHAVAFRFPGARKP